MTTCEAFANNLGCECEVCSAGRAFEGVRLDSTESQSWRVFLVLLIWLLRDSGCGGEVGDMLWPEIPYAWR